MAMRNPKGRANYEPNSWQGEERGPREDPKAGFTSYPQEVSGQKLRVRASSFADHYSQARQFYISQTETEQKHMVAALVFELSKVETPAIRERLVGHLRHIDDGLAGRVAEQLRLGLPEKPEPAATPIPDLPPSPALSILRNGPGRFAGRRMGLLTCDGVPATEVAALREAVAEAAGMLTVVAPMIGGVSADDGSQIEVQETIQGGTSVLFDAVAVIVSAEGAETLVADRMAVSWIGDAFLHGKFMLGSDAAQTLFEDAGIPPVSEGVITLTSDTDCGAFLERCGRMRVWDRF